MKNILKEFLNRRKKTAEDVKAEAEKNRMRILSDGQVAKRLLANVDFISFCQRLAEDREALNEALLDEKDGPKTEYQRTRLISRVHQIDMVLGKARSMIWQMENLTEVRAALQEKTHVGQAHGKQTGGRNGQN